MYYIDKEDKKVEDIYFRQCMTCHKIYGCKSEDHCLTCKSCINGQMPDNKTTTKKAKIQLEYTTGKCSDCFKDYTRTRILEKNSENIEILVDRLVGHTKNKNRIRIKIGRI